MTLFGIDVSHHQGDLDLRVLAERNDIHFVAAKATEGASFKDSMFQFYWQQAQEAGLMFAAYHFLRADSPISGQVANVQSVIGDSGIPVIIDCEKTNGTRQPKWDEVHDFRLKGGAAGLNVSDLLYLPKWYWSSIGEPQAVFALPLWQSAYGDNSRVYPGDESDRWTYSGRIQADVLQFTSRGRLNGYAGDLDINAYRGTREELAETGWFFDYREEDQVTPEDIQKAVATTPIIVGANGETQPLQRVLRQLLNRTQPSAKEISDAVLVMLDESVDGFSDEDMERAVANVLRKGTDEIT